MVVSTEIRVESAASFLNVIEETGDNKLVLSEVVSHTFILGPVAAGVITMGGSTGVEEQATSNRAILMEFNLIWLLCV
jgi:hypothetical protein